MEAIFVSLSIFISSFGLTSQPAKAKHCTKVTNSLCDVVPNRMVDSERAFMIATDAGDVVDTPATAEEFNRYYSERIEYHAYQYLVVELGEVKLWDEIQNEYNSQIGSSALSIDKIIQNKLVKTGNHGWWNQISSRARCDVQPVHCDAGR